MADYIVVHSVKVATEFVPETFGRLTTIGPVFWLPSGSKKEARQVCLCECGNTTLSRTACVKKGRTKSCGCVWRVKGPHARNKLVCGVGINDADYVTAEIIPGMPNKVCPYYATWRGMLKRCYSEKRLARDPCYTGCAVVEEWHRFSNFRKWMEKQNWQGMHLDKDFLTDSKLYGPDTCVFIPQWVNILFGHTVKNKKHGLPIGVQKSRRAGYYEVHVRVDGRTKTMRGFSNIAEAAIAYRTEKAKYIRSFYPVLEQIDARLVAACERRISQINSGF
jgi:hypothetical protein